MTDLLRLVRDRTGLDTSSDRRHRYEPAARRAMAAAGVRDPERYRALVASDRAALDALLDELTVGETYFFRDPRQFDALRSLILPDIARRGDRERSLTIWSAGCASGEEAYSLAIVAAELGLAGRARVVGTDISPARLAAARRAEYGKWSLRGVPDEVVATYFRRSGVRYQLVPSVREAATFHHHNLHAGPARGIVSDAPVRDADLILCRNVLIYLDGPAVEGVARRLLDCLADGGWLLLGPSDPLLADIVPCDVVVTDAGLAYRRPGRRAAPRARRPHAPDAAALAGTPAPVPPPLTPTAPESEATEETAAAALLAAAHERHAARDMAAAAALARRYVTRERERARPEGWVLLVRALADLGQERDAALACAAARGALYLDRTLAVAHLALGGALAREGRGREARVALGNALRLLEALPADGIVPASGGEPAARLAGLARAQLRLLGGGETVG